MRTGHLQDAEKVGGRPSHVGEDRGLTCFSAAQRGMRCGGTTCWARIATCRLCKVVGIEICVAQGFDLRVLLRRVWMTGIAALGQRHVRRQGSDKVRVRWESVAGKGDDGVEQGGPGQGAVAGVRQSQAAELERDRNGEATLHRQLRLACQNARCWISNA